MAEAMDRINPWEFLEWLAYWHVEPFGPEADNVNAAQIAAASMNGPGMVKKPVPVEHFILGKRTLHKAQTPEQMKNIFQTWANS